MTENMVLQDQQLVYRIDCDKHYTISGAPPILVLQKDSLKPPIIILEGRQTYPSKNPIIRDERRDRSQGYIFQDERKPPSDNIQLNPSTLSDLPSNHGGENLYSYQQPMPTPVNSQHLYTQDNQMNPSQDLSSFGKYSSDLSYNNNSVSSSPWAYGGQYQYRQPYDTSNYDGGPYSALPLENDTDRTNSMYGGGYSQSEPYHWQSSFYQHEPWTTPQPYPHSLPFFENNNSNNNFRNYSNAYDDRIYGREDGRMPLTPPRQAHYDSSYNYPSSTPWLSYNNIDNSPAMMPMQEDTTSYSPWNHYEHPTPPFRRNPNLPTDTRQPAFHVVNGPRRSKSVTFAPLPDHVAT